MPTKEKRIRRGVREAWICPIGHRFEIHECTENLIEASRWHILIQTIQPDGGMNMRVFRLFLGAVVLFASTAFAGQITYFADLSGLSEAPAERIYGDGLWGGYGRHRRQYSVHFLFVLGLARDHDCVAHSLLYRFPRRGKRRRGDTGALLRRVPDRRHVRNVLPHVRFDRLRNL